MRLIASKVYHGGGFGRVNYSGATIDTDVKVKVSNADTTADFLNPKVAAGAGIATAILNPGGNEQLQISAPGSTTDEKVKVRAADTTPGFVTDKLSFVNLTTNILNPGADETLQITGLAPPFTLVTVNDTTPDYLATKIVTGGSTGLSETILNPGGNEQLQLSVDNDAKVKVTNADTTADYLNPKITGINGIYETTLNPGGNEVLQLASDGKLLCSAGDTTRGYLHTDKLVAGTNITLTKQNPGGNENVKIDASGGDVSETIDLHFGTAAGLSSGSLIPQAVDGGSMPGAGHGYRLGAWKIKEIHALLNRYTSYAANSITVQVREVGSLPRSSVVTSASGAALTTITITAPGSSGGAFRYYLGNSSTGLNIAVNSGYMMFCCISAKSLNTATGVSVHIILERVPA